MSKGQPSPSRQAHLDTAAFQAAVERTAHDFDFRPALVEKDYFCSLILEAVAPPNVSWVFKGGTCLSKIYADFYRLSEDLDFCIPVQETTKRQERRRLIEPAKKIVTALPDKVPGVEIEEPLEGRNESTQYIAAMRYRSVITGDWEKVKVEIALREPLFRPAVAMNARTLARNVFTGTDLIPPFPVRVIDLTEALAEKVRAALSRLEPAIRDFFDIQYAMENLNLQVDTPDFLELLKKKLAIPGTGPVQLTRDRYNALEQQRLMELAAVLRGPDVEKFDLKRVWTFLNGIMPSKSGGC
ncbi:MAG TPA: nucleotidyl transferase AbiEii/AbiGii toxin family protein [Candidatus Omnitrophota bacterium]|nr:nucleotidyl transferase AbiEii/AbiGii toxin family protein [Candidatus Omnitrophota bacterium]